MTHYHLPEWLLCQFVLVWLSVRMFESSCLSRFSFEPQRCRILVGTKWGLCLLWLENQGETLVCVPLCKQYRSNRHLKKRPIKWQRDLILSLFSSTKQCAWIPVREEAVWQHRERACDCARSTGTAKRRANYHFALHGYQTEWPQKCLPA